MVILKDQYCVIQRCMRKCRRTSQNVFREFTVNYMQRWRRWCCLCSGDVIPSDVPKGHLPVYVGEDCKRVVIKVDLLNHPLFEALLDSAEEMFESSTRAGKLRIPCNETSFLCILESATENFKPSNCF